MKKIIFVSILAVILSIASLGLCGECDFYNDFGTPLVAPITSKGVIAQYIYNDEADPLPGSVRLSRIVYNQKSGNYPPARTFQYDVYGRIWKIRVYEPVQKKMMVEKVYFYESTDPDSMISRVNHYDTATGKILYTEKYAYATEGGIRKLKQIRQLVKTIIVSIQYQPDYNPLVFSDTKYTSPGYGEYREYRFTRNTQNHVIKAKIIVSRRSGSSFQVYSQSVQYRYNSDGKLVRMIEKGPFTTIDSAYVRVLGLLTRINDKGGKPVALYYYSRAN